MKTQKLAINNKALLLGFDLKPLEALYALDLSDQERAEAKHNLVNFVEMLITMDRQQKEWSKSNKKEKKGE